MVSGYIQLLCTMEEKFVISVFMTLKIYNEINILEITIIIK